jgi:hypothetical protein
VIFAVSEEVVIVHRRLPDCILAIIARIKEDR